MSKSTLDRTLQTRILVVDDEADVRLLLEREICDLGYGVVVVADAAQAMEEMGRGDFDIVITDIRMPGMDGMALAEWIKRTRPDTDVIVMTGYASLESAATAIHLGAFDYLLKPFGEMDLVTSSINRAVEKRTLEAKLTQSVKSLQAAKESFRNVVDRSTEGILVVGLDNVVRYLNPAAESIFDRKADELLGEVSGFDVVAGVATEIDILRQGGEPGIGEMRVAETEWEGESAYLVSLRDVTDRKRAEAQLKQANSELARSEKALRETLSDLKESHEQLKAAQSQLIQAEKLESVGRLAAGVAHEVKNPLAIMLQGIHYLSKHLTTNGDNVTLALQDMNNAVKRANSVVRGLLDFSAPSELGLNTEELNSVVEQSLSLVRHELAKYHINAVRELSECLPPVTLDRNKSEQVFVNIFLNAIHAMPEGGTLTIKTYTKQLTEVGHNVGSRKADDFSIGETVVMAEVEDTGTGIPKDQLSEVFDPFFTTQSTGKGTGLGLTVTKKIIDLHGGTINIGNRKEGGARVTIMFKA